MFSSPGRPSGRAAGGPVGVLGAEASPTQDVLPHPRLIPKCRAYFNQNLTIHSLRGEIAAKSSPLEKQLSIDFQSRGMAVGGGGSFTLPLVGRS